MSHVFCVRVAGISNGMINGLFTLNGAGHGTGNGKWWVSILHYVLYYRPQTKFTKGYVFTHACHSFHRGMPGPGGCLLWECLLPGGSAPRGVWRPPTPWWLLLRVVHILLECILVSYSVHPSPCPCPIPGPMQCVWAIRLGIKFVFKEPSPRPRTLWTIPVPGLGWKLIKGQGLLTKPKDQSDGPCPNTICYCC